ncbi:hypothetical protein SEMRO_2690_G334730.1 [Seminavis robusta]|uniref:Uncharacterized protein n=1 Tax=Seminavis robusta TaxID=568900 RepID=A0A9N8F3D2_9STRA|nr:hypothetical protein SEMRO_2690_G334730.1 [Seminavis robusta]|eukprot:Sro2690_g334730.1 n/a (187) ;mRNA; f:9291-9851
MVNFNTKDLKVKIYSGARDKGILPKESVDALCGALEWAFTREGSHRLVFSYGEHALDSDGESSVQAIIRKYGGKAHSVDSWNHILKRDGSVITTLEVTSGSIVSDCIHPTYRPEKAAIDDEEWFKTTSIKRSNKQRNRKKKPTIDAIPELEKLEKLSLGRGDEENESPRSACEDAAGVGLTQELFY